MAQVRTATRALTPLWWTGGRCSRGLAEAIAAQLTLTRHRNDKARTAHRKQTIRRLHAIGIKLVKLQPCRWQTG